MIRTHAVIWAVLVAAAAGFLFYTSHQAQELDAELEARHRAVIAEREAIRILHAEWAYLNEPGRLRELARRHTPLGPAMPVQIVADIDDIPLILPGIGPGIGAAPGVPLPPRKPQPGTKPGPMVSANPRIVPAAAEITPPEMPAAPPEASGTQSDEPLHALLASFRARQSTGQAGSGQ
jgi:hypothetical protein